jgi:TPR repeat protein
MIEWPVIPTFADSKRPYNMRAGNRKGHTMRIAFGTAVFATFLALRAMAATPLNDCDRLAANPPDPDRVAAGVERKDINLPVAIAACKKAVAEHPDVPRFSYQLGRVLFYDNQTAPSLASFQRAADGGYRQARFMIGLLMTRKYAGVPQDDCKVAQLWTMAAQQHHFNAEVSLVRDQLHGRFKACPTQLSKDEMRAFLKDAEPQVDYLARFLVDDLEAQLDAH